MIKRWLFRAVMLGILLGGMAWLAREAWHVAHPPKVCVRSHQEGRHRPAWVQFIPVGKTIMTIYHPAYDYKVEVCDEWVQPDSKTSTH